MKKIYLILCLAFLGSTLILSSCKDDETVNGDGNTGAIICKILTSMDSYGEKITYTFDGDNLVKTVSEEDGSTYTTTYTYENGKLSKADDGSEVYIVVYNGETVDSVEIRDSGDNELYGYIKYTYANGKPATMEVYEIESPDPAFIIERYVLTWNGNNVTKVVISELDDDENLVESSTIEISSMDDQKNPFYGLPLLYSSDYDDFRALMPNNVLNFTLKNDFGTIPATFEYTYKDGYPTRAISTLLGEKDTTDYTYNCD